MGLVRLITLPYVRRHRVRSLLTVAAVAMGVAIFVAIHAANQSVLHGFQTTVLQLAGRTELQVSAGESGLVEDLLERVRAVSGVHRAVPVIEAVVQTGLRDEGNLLLVAVDLIGDGSLRDYDVQGDDEAVRDPLEFLAQPDSLIITREFAARTGLQIGSRFPMRTMAGDKRFTIRGILQTGGMASAFGGNLAVMDIYAAQKMLGRGRTFDRIDIVVSEGASVPEIQARLQAELGSAFQVEPPARRSDNFQALLAGYGTLTDMTSLFALIISLFVIYNAFAVAVVERRSEIGILRSLGATRRQIGALFLAESVIFGLVGAALGILGGLGLVGALARQTTTLAARLSGRLDAPPVVLISNELLIAAAVIGVITSMVAAWLPARSAARVDPVSALQKGKYQVQPVGESRRRRLLAVALAILAAGCLFSSSMRVFYLGYGLFVGASILLAPTLSLLLARGLRGLLTALRPVEGALAADSLLQAPRRTSATVAGLMLSLAMVIGMAGISRSAHSSIGDWVTLIFNADLLISTSEGVNPDSFHFPASLAGDLEALSGVEAVRSVRAVRVPIDGSPVMIIGVEMNKRAERDRSRPVVTGSWEWIHQLAGNGQGVIASENLMVRQHLRVGDPIAVPTPGGMLRLPIVGVFPEYSNQAGAIYLDLAVYRRWWGDDSLDLVHVYLRPGVDPESARRQILARFQSERRLFALRSREVRKYVVDIADQWFTLTYIQIGVAVLVAVLGIINALTVSIIDRRRELAVLRALGGLRSQIRQAVRLEAVTIALVGVALGLALGGLNLYYQLETVRRSVISIPLNYMFPTGIALALFPAMLCVAYLSALGPAESAVRTPLVEALEYE
jgi:putative ABC transport system permease protein